MIDVENACDTHMHFYDSRYPTASTATLFPPDASPEMYVDYQAAIGTTRTVVVQPTTYGLDNSCQLDAMKSLRERTHAQVRGVMVVDSSVTEHELSRLHEAGVRGARFHMLAGGAVGWDDLPIVAAKVANLGWHIQLQLNGHELSERLDSLLSLPVDVVVDHVGRFMPPVGMSDPKFAAMLRLVDRNGWVKLSAPYESTEAPPYSAVSALCRALVEAAPNRLLWATNWPHPGRDSPPAAAELLDLLHDWIPNDHDRRRILVDNPSRLYDFDDAKDPQ